MKYFVVTDIHGRYIDINTFKEKGFDVDNPSHIIVMLGDYFDRGDYNREVFEFLQEYKEILKDRLVLIKGNHDEFLEGFVDHTLKYCNLVDGEMVTDKLFIDLWAQNGGKKTIRQLFGGITVAARYTPGKHRQIKRLKKLLDSMVDYYETDKYIFTHASINANKEVDTWSRELIYEDNPIGKDIYIGHTPFEHLSYVTIEDYAYGRRAYSTLGNRVYCIDDQSSINVLVLEDPLEECPISQKIT